MAVASEEREDFMFIYNLREKKYYFTDLMMIILGEIRGAFIVEGKENLGSKIFSEELC